MEQRRQALARRIGLPLLVCYGLGTILGAGIYVLVGKVAAVAGLLTPVAFLLAGLVAGVTGLSYCQLVINFPRSAGEAYYVGQGFRRPWCSTAIGYLVILTGIVSAATLANGFAGYLQSFIDLPRMLIVLGVIVVMGLVTLWGIAEALWLAALITLIELSGLLMVILLGGDALAKVPEQAPALFLPLSAAEWGGVISGGFLAFYAFIGFEDMVNVAEEVKQPERTMPQGILLALTGAGVLYVLVALVAVVAFPLDQLIASDAPLRDLLKPRYPTAGKWLGLISLLAILNGVLVQLIMASRVLYGMAAQNRAPAVFGAVWQRTRTPWLATLTMTAIAPGFALWLPLEDLARITSFIILLVFASVNLALWRLLRRGEIEKNRRLPCWPLLGTALCSGMLVFQLTVFW